MRRILYHWRREDCPQECVDLQREAMRLATLSIFDVRVLGAIAALLIMLTLTMPTNPEPVQRIAPSLIAPGEHGAQVASFAISPTGGQIVTTNTAGGVTLRASSSGWRIERLLDFPGYARSVAFSPDGQSLAVAGIAPGVCIWNLMSLSRQPTRTMALPVRKATSVLFSHDGRSLAVTTDPGGTVLLIDLVTQRERMVFRHPSPVTSIAFSPEGHRLATGGKDDRWIVLWDLQTGSCRMMLDDERGPATALAFSPDGATLASARCSDHRVRLWDVRSWRECRSITGHGRSVNSIAFSPDGVLLATVGNDGMLGLWTVATGQRRVTLDVMATSLQTVAFSPDGRTLVLATGDDDDIRVWDVADLLGAGLDPARHR